MNVLTLTVTTLCIIINAIASYMNYLRPDGEGIVQAWCFGVASILWVGSLIYQIKTRYD